MSLVLGWFRGISRHRRWIPTYLIVALSLFAYLRYRDWRNWETAAAEWYLLEPPFSNELLGDISLDPSAPISQWRIDERYRSKSDCEKGQSKKETFAAGDRCMPASNQGIQHTERWWSLVPSDQLSRRNPSQVTSNFLRNLPGDFVNLSRNLLLRPADVLPTALIFLFAAYLLSACAIFTVGAFRGGDYQELQQWGAGAMVIFGVGFFLRLDVDYVDLRWPWEWAAGFAFAYLVHQHPVRENKYARHAGLSERLLSSLWDAAEGLWFLAIGVLALFLFVVCVDLGSGKFSEAWHDSIWVWAAMSLGWIGIRFFTFGHPFRDRNEPEIGSQAWLKENPGGRLVAHSLGLGNPPWNEEQISRLRERLDQIHAEWEAKVNDYLNRHPSTGQ
jgi:hypothetical protein